MRQPPTRASAPSAGPARVAVSVLFLANGALYANVVPRLPAIKADLGLSNASLGTALAAAPLGALLSGIVAGLLVSRTGSGRLSVACGVGFGSALGLVGLAPSWLALAAVLAVLGAFDAVMDVAMNAHGLRVQRVYGRSVINALHAWWSVGAALGGSAGAAAAAAGLPVAVHLGVAGGSVALAVLAAARWLLPGHDREDEVSRTAAGSGVRRTNVVRGLGVVGVVALFGAVVEDVPASWSAVYLRDELGAEPGFAGMAFVAFTVAMTLGRFVNDRLVERHGDVIVARVGAMLVVLGLVPALLVASVPAAVVGFALAGLGASPIFPALFHAAGSRPGVRAADGIALVSWVARAGFFLAPPLVGVVADAAGLGVGVAAAVGAAGLVAVLAGSLRPVPR